MIHQVEFKDAGMIPYAEAWDLQKEYFNRVLEVKLFNKNAENEENKPPLNYLLFCEHPHVYTIGKSGKDDNLLIDTGHLKQYGAEFFHIDRGGDITYHGPGQIVGYPIIDLQLFGIGVKDYVYRLEESVIEMLGEYGIRGERLKGATGVWLDPGVPGKARKICAIGVKVSRSVTMHGFAFNIKTNLDYFNYINPCGFTDKGVTSLEKELGVEVDLEGVKEILKDKIAAVYAMQLNEKS